MITDVSEEPKNTCDSIRPHNESDSTETDESDSQQLKQEEPRISTIRGMMMEVREEPENA
jgi:hypothetical protein